MTFWPNRVSAGGDSANAAASAHYKSDRKQVRVVCRPVEAITWRRMGAKDEPRRSAPFRDEKTLPSSGSRTEEDTHLLVFGAVTLSHPIVEGTTLTIGRSLEADLCLDDPSLSRLHAKLHVGPATHGDSGLRIRDLSSSNGTRVSGE